MCLHVADPEDLASVSECIDAYPDMSISRRGLANLGVLFGTDAVPGGLDVPQQLFCAELSRAWVCRSQSCAKFTGRTPAAYRSCRIRNERTYLPSNFNLRGRYYQYLLTSYQTPAAL